MLTKDCKKGKGPISGSVKKEYMSFSVSGDSVQS